MMTMTTALITSRDPKGRQATSIFEAAYDKAKLDNARAQLLNERGGELQTGIMKLIAELTMFNQYVAEEIRSSCAYPPEYKGSKPIEQQVKAIAEIFALDPSLALEFVKNLPGLPSGAEGWFAIPSIDALAAKHFPKVADSAERYCRAVQLTHKKLGNSRAFYNYREGEIDRQHLRVHARTADALAIIQATQKGDILIVAAQLGMRHRGRSVRCAREVFVANEFGLSAFMVGSIALTHPERFVRAEELGIDCAGDEWSYGGVGRFVKAPIFRFGDGELKFVARVLDTAYGSYGSASGFLPQ